MQIGEMELLFNRIERSECVNELCLISRMVMLHINISIPLPPIMQVGEKYQSRYVMRPSKHPTVLHKRGR